jgi:D-cysteine desulfhydrase
MSHKCGAELNSCGVELDSPVFKPLVYLTTTYQLILHRLKTGHFPQIIPAGGSSPLGAAGFVNAAFELKEQISNGEIPEPDYIYVAAGTMGTAAGLMLGLKAAGLKSRVVSVRVTDLKFTNVKLMLGLIGKINSLLSSLDPSFPALQFSDGDVDMRHDFFGQKYAVFTSEGMAAVSLAERIEGVKLDGTYTGKTFAAIISDSKSRGLKDKVVLFWNTLNSRDFTEEIAGVDYHHLPRSFHRYFEEEVQPLDG